MNGILLPNYIADLDEKILVLGFHKMLLQEHTKSGFTNGEVASFLGVNSNTISRYLHGRTSCSIGTLKKLSLFYDCDFLEKVFHGSFLFALRLISNN